MSDAEWEAQTAVLPCGECHHTRIQVLERPCYCPCHYPEPRVHKQGLDTLPPIYKTLRSRVNTLQKLLTDAHPGLWSWCNCVAVEVKAIAEMYGGTR